MKFPRMLVELSQRQRVCITLLVSASLKIAYALSRNLFESGPDANGYIPFAVSFASHHFTSQLIWGPYYPSGYPFFLSVIVRIVGKDWFQIAQIAQILIFSIGAYMYFYLVSRIFGAKIAWASFLILAFNPAWAVANGEAMYETFFVSFLIFSMVSLFKHISTSNLTSSKWLIVGGFFAGVCISIHPRAILLYVLLMIYLICSRTKDFKSITIYSLSLLVVPLIFATRNFAAKKGFTLMSSFWDGESYNAFLSGCRSTDCALTRIAASPLDFLHQCYLNGIRFWSPHSGPMERGTWLHNISLLSLLNRNGYWSAAVLLSVLISFLVFFFWFIGSFLIYKRDRFYGSLFTLCSLAIWSTDIFYYGENRHRLIALIFTLPAQTLMIFKVYEKLMFLIRKRRVNIV